MSFQMRWSSRPWYAQPIKDAIADAVAKTDGLFRSGAYAIGAQCQITTMPGYLPALSAEANEEVLAAAQIASPVQQKKTTK